MNEEFITFEEAKTFLDKVAELRKEKLTDRQMVRKVGFHYVGEMRNHINKCIDIVKMGKPSSDIENIAKANSMNYNKAGDTDGDNRMIFSNREQLNAGKDFIEHYGRYPWKPWKGGVETLPTTKFWSEEQVTTVGPLIRCIILSTNKWNFLTEYEQNLLDYIANEILHESCRDSEMIKDCPYNFYIHRNGICYYVGAYTYEDNQTIKKVYKLRINIINVPNFSEDKEYCPEAYKRYLEDRYGKQETL